MNYSRIPLIHILEKGGEEGRGRREPYIKWYVTSA